MSTLVSWTHASAAPLTRGMWPKGTTHEDFESSPDNEILPNTFVATTTIDAADFAAHGLTAFTMPAPVQKYRTRLKPGEVIALLKDPGSPTKGSYAKIYRAAYPHGSAPADDLALEFLEQAKFPYSEDGMIDVAEIIPGLTYFMSAPQNYIDQDDFDRVVQGWPVEG